LSFSSFSLGNAHPALAQCLLPAVAISFLAVVFVATFQRVFVLMLIQNKVASLHGAKEGSRRH